ncbi:hypothetical protein AQUCO_00200071v1 [Aquilegia coerulea]|uniref:Protein kinase domain-containing protein n=1 Tax=Aquilegia coerulea TaxID=218851 RepID=A0A2G5F1G9_AQUCA|nr:hypothetical protein AQUCO_00200071v1 [Aquilegia coerulea]
MKFSLNLLLCIFFFFFLILFFSSPSLAEPRATLAGRVCTNRTADQPNRRIFVSNFLAALDGITPQISSRRYGTTIKGTGNNTVYALGECMKDLSQRDCDQCFAQCKTDILRCLPFQRGVRGGRNYFDGCYLRYDDYNFFQEIFSQGDETVCVDREFNGSQAIYATNIRELVGNLSTEAVKNNGFFVGSLSRRNVTVYGLAQCWETISRNSCDMCLKNASSQIQSCSRMEEGRVLNAGCYMRYSPQRFYNNSDIDAVGGGGGGGRRLAIILASVFSALAALMIFASCAFFGRRRLRRRKKERKQLGALAATVKRSDLNFKYEVLERATKYFDSSNKLGQGGSGSVYKGTLPDGKHVAVKRLIFSTRQWVDQFFNEVNLISAVHHKNLVKLLGCSITGPESLLVYEYIPNRSLQENLFSRHNNRELSWKERYNIILGTAEGLAYLHEESKLRIIHRDIKLSNILLDENFTAKIADFGLVRLFPENMSHISTAIAGTLGYMAPEYVVRGKLTEKADVYSFGVLVIEVVSGRKNNSFSQDTSILQLVWNHYMSVTLFEAVDPALAGTFEDEEASRVLHIGLLCTQASPELRPAMSTVVKLLTSNHDLPQPTPPPFLNSSSMQGSSKSSEVHDSQLGPDSRSSGNNQTQSWIEPR